MKLINRIKCFFGRHKFYVILEIDYCNRRVGCRNCEGEWGMNDNVKAFIRWDDDLEIMYKLIGKIK